MTYNDTYEDIKRLIHAGRFCSYYSPVIKLAHSLMASIYTETRRNFEDSAGFPSMNLSRGYFLPTIEILNTYWGEFDPAITNSISQLKLDSDIDYSLERIKIYIEALHPELRKCRVSDRFRDTLINTYITELTYGRDGDNMPYHERTQIENIIPRAAKKQDHVIQNLIGLLCLPSIDFKLYWGGELSFTTKRKQILKDYS